MKAKDSHGGGIHLLLTLSECDAAALGDARGVERAFYEAVRNCGSTIVDRVAHDFPGGGYTCVFLLAESHASIHTYPEIDACHIDLFACSATARPEDFEAVMVDHLRPGRIERQMIRRMAAEGRVASSAGG